VTQYICYNGPMQTTAAFAGVTTGTAIKTMLQIATPAAFGIRVKAWGIFFDGNAAATPIKCELIETGSVAANVTAHVAAGLQAYDTDGVGIGGGSQMTLGATATGYSATAENTITATRVGDLLYVPPSQGYMYEWSLGDEFAIGPSKILRVRVHAPAAVNCVTWVRWKE
jgi:hypothetical protein